MEIYGQKFVKNSSEVRIFMVKAVVEVFNELQ